MILPPRSPSTWKEHIISANFVWRPSTDVEQIACANFEFVCMAARPWQANSSKPAIVCIIPLKNFKQFGGRMGQLLRVHPVRRRRWITFHKLYTNNACQPFLHRCPQQYFKFGFIEIKQFWPKDWTFPNMRCVAVNVAKRPCNRWTLT